MSNKISALDFLKLSYDAPRANELNQAIQNVGSLEELAHIMSNARELSRQNKLKITIPHRVHILLRHSWTLTAAERGMFDVCLIRKFEPAHFPAAVFNYKRNNREAVLLIDRETKEARSVLPVVYTNVDSLDVMDDSDAPDNSFIYFVSYRIIVWANVYCATVRRIPRHEAEKEDKYLKVPYAVQEGDVITLQQAVLDSVVFENPAIPTVGFHS